MNKLTIALLSMLLPVAVQADQYVCVEEQGAMITKANSLSYAKDAGDTHVIDTNLGFKRLGEESYEGSCSLLNGDLSPSLRVIVCEYTEVYLHESLMMFGNDNTFSYIEQTDGYTIASTGICSKL